MDAVYAAENFRWGVIAFHKGYYSDALLSFEKALGYQPTDLQSRIWLGRSLYKSGFEQAALAEWQFALDSGAQDTVLRNQVRLLTLRRGLGEELEQEEQLVVSSEIDAHWETYYPFRRPTAVIPRADGTVYVVAYGTNEIVQMDANNDVRVVLKGGLDGFDHPFDAVETDDGFLFVSEYRGNRIARCTQRGDKLAVFGTAGTGDGMLLGPQYLALGPDGYLYVTDWGNRRVSKFDREGNFVLSFAEGLSGPSGIAISGQRVYVADNVARRIGVYDLSGNLLGIVGEGFLTGPEGLWFDDSETLLVADKTRIAAFDLAQEIWTVRTDVSSYGQRIVDVGRTANGDLVAVDFDSSKIFLLSEMSSLYLGYLVRIEQIVSVGFPTIYVDFSVEDPYGKPIVGLREADLSITEAGGAVASVSLMRSNTDSVPLEVVLLIDRSVDGQSAQDVAFAADEIHRLLDGHGRMKVISIGEDAVAETTYGETRLRVQRALVEVPYERWVRLDVGIRAAVADLVGSRSQKLLIFVTDGTLGERAFGQYSLAESLQYLRNNFVAFCPVYIADGAVDMELEYLAEATQGTSYRLHQPQGIRQLISDARLRIASLYTLSYESHTDPDLGDRFIPLEVAVFLQKRSGRDHSGYYGSADF